MNKLKILALLGACGAVLGACSDDVESDKTATSQETEQMASSSSETSAVESESTNEEFYFKDDELVINDLKIKITDTKVIPVGETGNEYGEKPVIAFWYDTTNLTDKDIDPTVAWMAVFEAYQDNDPDRLNNLNVGGLPDDQFLDTQLDTIKENGTVPNAVSYELDDDFTPVTLKANQGIGGKDLGEEIFEIN